MSYQIEIGHNFIRVEKTILSNKTNTRWKIIASNTRRLSRSNGAHGRNMIPTNSIYCGDNIEVMKDIDNNIVDLTVTSPPYDDLRIYNGFSFDFKECSKELYRITKPGGVIVWVVGDSTKNGSESGTSFRQALRFMKLGFNLHDTMIYKKHGMPTDPRLRYYQRFDYMFVFSKGKPKSYNPIADVKSSGRKNANGTDRKGDVLLVTKKRYDYPEFSIRGNIWEYDCRNMGVKHPAAFPAKVWQRSYYYVEQRRRFDFRSILRIWNNL